MRRVLYWHASEICFYPCPLQHFCPINPILLNAFINTLNKDMEDMPIKFTGGIKLGE